MKKITLLLALLSFTFGKAQWTTDTAVNTLVSNSIGMDSKSIGTNDGKTFIVFWKQVPGPVNFELRAQLLDSNGVQQFGPDGMLISNTIPMSTSTVFWKMTIDKDNNLYIGVTGTGAGTPGFVFKIDTAGTMLWGANGVNLGTGYLPTVLPLSTGEVMISYWPGTKAKIQKYTNLGVPVWPSPIDVVSSNAASATTPADMYEMSNHDVVLVFHRKLSFGVASNLFAQRYSYTDGATVWATPTQIADKGTAYNSFYSGTQDGNTVFYGFSCVTGTAPRFDSYVTRINEDGTLPWGFNGIDADISQTFYEKDVKINTTPGSNYVWAISRYTPSSQDLYGEYVQKFDKLTGERLFTDNGKEIFAVDNHYKTHISNLFLVNDAPLFLIKSGLDNGVTPTALSILQLDMDGGFIWPDHTYPIATFTANKSLVNLNTPFNGQAVAVFNEEKVAGELKMYAQNFTNPTLGVSHLETSNSISIYPNPSNNIFTIDSNQNITAVRVLDLLGKEIYNNKNINAPQTSIDASTWAKGIYIITTTTNSTLLTSLKFIKN